MRKLLVIFIIFAGLLNPNFAMLWDGAGHMVIAAEAYRELSPQLKAQVFEVLKAHPDFAKWEKAYQPDANLIQPHTCSCVQAPDRTKFVEKAIHTTTRIGTTLIT